MKMFNLYWGDSGRLSSGSPHDRTHVIDARFEDALTEDDARQIDMLPISGKHVDADGDTWERIA